MIQVVDAMRWADEQLETAKVPDARRVIRLLMQDVLNVDAAGLIGWNGGPLTQEQEARFTQLVKRVETEPVYRVLGAREFHGLTLQLGADTLEPRDDTETLIDLVISRLGPRRDDALRFADLGTGTGAIGLALMSELPKSHAVLSDISPSALQVARINAKALGFEERVQFVEGSWTDPLTENFDFIVSNPPYIATEVMQTLDTRVRDFDPHLALDGGADGLDAYRLLLRDCKAHLQPNGFAAFEIGYDQAQLVSNMAEGEGWTVETVARDLNGHDRAILLGLVKK